MTCDNQYQFIFLPNRNITPARQPATGDKPSSQSIKQIVGVSAEPHTAGTKRKAKRGIPSGQAVPILSNPKLPFTLKIKMNDIQGKNEDYKR